jgi:hypothetical protein
MEGPLAAAMIDRQAVEIFVFVTPAKAGAQ